MMNKRRFQIKPLKPIKTAGELIAAIQTVAGDRLDADVTVRVSLGGKVKMIILDIKDDM